MTDHIPDLTIETLGDAKIPSPLNLSTAVGDRIANYVRDDERVLFDPIVRPTETTRAPLGAPLTFELAGPRDRLYFDSSKLRVGVVTCGGLCPGTNTVIRALVMQGFWPSPAAPIMTPIRLPPPPREWRRQPSPPKAFRICP